MRRQGNATSVPDQDSAAANSLVLSPIASLSTAQAVQRHVEKLILAGVLRPGEKLPPERILAEQLGVSRSVLRSALKNLADLDLIRSTQGGGNYINEVIGTQMTNPIAGLLREHSQALDDFMEFRAEFEGSTSYLAAARATGPDIAALQLIFDRMEAAHFAGDLRVESVLDSDFHMAIAELSHNIIFIHISHSLRMLMQEEMLNIRMMLFDAGNGVNGSGDRQLVLEQHRAVLEAIREKDSQKAAGAMREHIRFVQVKLREIASAPERYDIARQRLSRWVARTASKPK